MAARRKKPVAARRRAHDELSRAIFEVCKLSAERARRRNATAFERDLHVLLFAIWDVHSDVTGNGGAVPPQVASMIKAARSLAKRRVGTSTPSSATKDLIDQCERAARAWDAKHSSREGLASNIATQIVAFCPGVLDRASRGAAPRSQAPVHKLSMYESTEAVRAGGYDALVNLMSPPWRRLRDAIEKRISRVVENTEQSAPVAGHLLAKATLRACGLTEAEAGDLLKVAGRGVERHHAK